MLYLDHNATTQPDDAVVEAMARSMREAWGNPSSMHSWGERARAALEHSRAQVAALVGCAARGVVFTSGGTEACALALRSCIGATTMRGTIVCSRIEHSAVRDPIKQYESSGGDVVWLDGDPTGVVSPAEVERALGGRDDISLVCLQWANSETGVVQRIAEVGRVCRSRRVPFFVDAVQWAGKGVIDMRSLPIDMLAISAHKFHGPKGAGALIVGDGTVLSGKKEGSPQEGGRRAGTEAHPALIGFGVAAELASRWLAGDGRDAATHVARIRDAFEERVVAALPGAIIIARSAARIWNTSLIAFPGLEAAAIVLALSRRGVCASAGSACSSGSLEPSPALLAMGVPHDVAHGAVRFSFGRDANESMAFDAADRVIAVVRRVAAIGGSATPG